MLVVNQAHLETILREYCLHYNEERPHRSRNLHPPAAGQDRVLPAAAELERTTRLGGLLSTTTNARRWPRDLIFAPHSPGTEGSSELERLIDFGQEVPRRERLGQVEVCPGGEAGVDVGLLGRSREQDHLGTSEFGFGSDRVQDVHPCSSRHANIEQYE